MTDTTQQPSAFNVTRVAPETQGVPQTGPFKPKESKTKVSDKPVVRSIPAITKYNLDSGLIEPDAEKTTWGKRSVAEVGLKENEPSIEATPAEDASYDHSKWKQEQAAKKQERNQKKNEKAAQQQVLAKDLLQKGDIVGAARALGMTPTDLITYMDNARLSIPNKTEELTPEQQRAADEEAFKSERLAFEEEQRAFKYQTVKQSYTRDKILPILADADKFEMVNQANADGSITDYIYEYMNKHFVETGEELSAADVAESIENELYTARSQALEAAKKTKKLAKFFTPQELREMADEAEQTGEERVDLGDATKARKVSFSRQATDQFYEPTLDNTPAVSVDSRFPARLPEPDMDEVEAAESKYLPKTKATRNRTGNMNVSHPIFLPKEERLAQIRREMGRQ